MRQAQPPGELGGGLLRCRSVEGHECSGHPGRALELRAPAGANQRDFNLIRAPGDVFFEVMNVHVCDDRSETGVVILRGRYMWSSEARREDGVHSPGQRDRRNIPDEEKSQLSASAQVLHEPCTGFPHLTEEVVDPVDN